jgi:probable HAF family extracellular repeat protein
MDMPVPAQVNANCTIVGTAQGANGPSAVLWGLPDFAPIDFGFGISGIGITNFAITGEAFFSGGSNAYIGFFDGRFVTITVPDATNSVGVGINSSDQVAMNSTFADGRSRAYLYDYNAGFLADVTSFGGSATVAVGITEAGEIAGWSTDASQNKHAFYFTNADGIVQLPALYVDDIETEATSIMPDAPFPVITGVSRGILGESPVFWTLDPSTLQWVVFDLIPQGGGTGVMFGDNCIPGSPIASTYCYPHSVAFGVAACDHGPRAYLAELYDPVNGNNYYDLNLLYPPTNGDLFERVVGGHCFVQGGIYYADMDGFTRLGKAFHLYSVPLPIQ